MALEHAGQAGGTMEQGGPGAHPAGKPLDGRTRHWVHWLAAAFAMALLLGGSLLAGWHRVPAHDSHLPTDGAQGQFIFAQVARAVWGHGSLLWTRQVWYPTGYPFLLSEQNILDALLISPFVHLVGPTLPIAWFAFSILMTNALAGAWLARRVAGPGWAPWAGAVILGTSPYVIGELSCGRVTQAWLVPMCLTLGMAWEAAKHGGRVAALTGVLLALTGYHYWFYGLLIAPGVAAMVLGRVGWRRGGVILSTIGVVTLLLIAPAVVYVSGHWAAMPGVDIDAEAFRWPAQLLAGLPGMDPNLVDHKTRYLPHLLFLVMGASTFAWPRRVSISLSIVALWLVVLSLGTHWTIGDTKVLLPYGWMARLPGLSRFWWPARALGAATVVLVPVAALLFRRLKGTHRFAGGAALLLMVFQTLWLPGRLQAIDAPCDTTWTAATPEGAILVLPMLDEAVGRRASFEQPCHGRPLVNGNGMWDAHLWPASFKAFYETQPVLKAFVAAEKKQETEDAVAAFEVGRLASAGVRTILMPSDRLEREGSAQEAALLEEAVGPATCVSDGYWCYWVLPDPQDP